MVSAGIANFPSKIIYVDYRGIYSSKYTPGALSENQFNTYAKLLTTGIGREKARELASQSPKR